MSIEPILMNASVVAWSRRFSTVVFSARASASTVDVFTRLPQTCSILLTVETDKPARCATPSWASPSSVRSCTTRLARNFVLERRLSFLEPRREGISIRVGHVCRLPSDHDPDRRSACRAHLCSERGLYRQECR